MIQQNDQKAVAAGTVKLVGNSQITLFNEVEELLQNEKSYEKMSEASNPYGDGKACERIVIVVQEI